MRARNCRAQGVDFSNGAVHDCQNKIEIMDHQVKNDRNVCPPRFVWGNAGCLDVERGSDPFGDGAVFSGIAQQVANLECFSSLSRQFGQSMCLVQSGSDRFFDQNMPPGPESLAGQGKMIFCRSRDDDGIDLFEKIFVICGNSATSFGCYDGGACRIGIVEGDKLFGRV